MYTAPGEALPCEHDVRSEQAAGLRSVAALRISSQHRAATGAPVRAAASCTGATGATALLRLCTQR